MKLTPRRVQIAESGQCSCKRCGVALKYGLHYCEKCALLPPPNEADVVQNSARQAPSWVLICLALLALAAAGWQLYRKYSPRRSGPVDAEITPVETAAAAEPVAGSVPIVRQSEPQQRAPETRTAAVAVPSQPQPPMVTQPPPPRPVNRAVKMSATCRACNGRGRRNTGRGGTRTCPICHGTPTKTRWVTPPFTLCAKCSGFGRVLEVRKGAELPTTCRECNGCGLVKK